MINIKKLNDDQKDELKTHLSSYESIIQQSISGSNIRLCYESNVSSWNLYKLGDKKIDVVDKTLMNFYYQVDRHLRSVDFNQLNTDYIYSLKYNHNTQELYLSYILESETLTEIYDLQEIEKYSKILDIKPQNIIYNQILEQNIINKIINGDLKNINVKIPAIDKKYFLYELQRSSESTKTNFYDLILIDFGNFLSNEKLNDYQIQGISKDVKYLDLICKLFNNFMNQNKLKYQDLDVEKPDFLKRDSFNLTTYYIINKETIELFEENDTHKDIFKIILNAHRNTKNKTNDIFTQNNLLTFNNNVKRIEGFVLKQMIENLNPGDQETFLSYQNDSLYWKSNDFKNFTNQKLLAIYDLHKTNKKLVTLVLHNKDKELQNYLLELVKEYYFIKDILLDNDEYSFLNTTEVEKMIGYQIKDVNISKLTFEEFKNIVPRPLHKFYEKIKIL